MVEKFDLKLCILGVWYYKVYLWDFFGGFWCVGYFFLGGGLKMNYCNYISINFFNFVGFNIKFDEFFFYLYWIFVLNGK